MTTYKTGNPLGSAAVKDLYDNAENLDIALHTPEEIWVDRLGNTRRSWAGSTGYDLIGDYAAGIKVAAFNQIIRADGEFWRAAPGIELPYTTTGAGMPEDGAFVSVGDASLRQALSDGTGASSGAAMIGYGDGTVADALGDVSAMRVPYVASDDEPPHISVLGKLRQFIFPEDFGALGDNAADDFPAFQAALAESRRTRAPLFLAKKKYRLSQPLTLQTGDSIQGAGAQFTALVFDLQPTENCIKPVDDTVRSYGWKLSGFAIEGTGKAGIYLGSVSQAVVSDVRVASTLTTGIDIFSSQSGFAVYNRFINITTATPLGIWIHGTSSNANIFIGCRTNLATNIGVYVSDSNDNHFYACQFEAGGTGRAVSLRSTVGGLNYGNTFTACRVEQYVGGTGYDIGTNVLQTQIIAPVFINDGIVTPILDAGTGTVVQSASPMVGSTYATQAQKVMTMVRAANGGDGSNALLELAETVTTTGNPTTLRLTSVRATGYPVELRRGGVRYFAINAMGNIVLRSPNGANYVVSVDDTGKLVTAPA